MDELDELDAPHRHEDPKVAASTTAFDGPDAYVTRAILEGSTPQVAILPTTPLDAVLAIRPLPFRFATLCSTRQALRTLRTLRFLTRGSAWQGQPIQYTSARGCNAGFVARGVAAVAIYIERAYRCVSWVPSSSIKDSVAPRSRRRTQPVLDCGASPRVDQRPYPLTNCDFKPGTYKIKLIYIQLDLQCSSPRRL